jgi:hypothetical protein
MVKGKRVIRIEHKKLKKCHSVKHTGLYPSTLVINNQAEQSITSFFTAKDM